MERYQSLTRKQKVPIIPIIVISVVAAAGSGLVTAAVIKHNTKKQQADLQSQISSLQSQVAAAALASPGPTPTPAPTLTPTPQPTPLVTPTPAKVSQITANDIYNACQNEPKAQAKGEDGYDFICAQKEVYLGDFDGDGNTDGVIIMNTSPPKAIGDQRFVLFENKNGKATFVDLSDALPSYDQFVLPIVVKKGEIDVVVSDTYQGQAPVTTDRVYTMTDRGLNFQ